MKYLVKTERVDVPNGGNLHYLIIKLLLLANQEFLPVKVQEEPSLKESNI